MIHSFELLPLLMLLLFPLKLLELLPHSLELSSHSLELSLPLMLLLCPWSES